MGHDVIPEETDQIIIDMKKRKVPQTEMEKTRGNTKAHEPKPKRSKRLKGTRPCGLQNTGNNCYAISALQCLSFTKPLKSFLFSETYNKECDNLCFSCDLRRHINRIRKEEKPFDPDWILSHIKSFGGDFLPGRQQDVQEFIGKARDAIQMNSDKHGYPKKNIIDNIFGGKLQYKMLC